MAYMSIAQADYIARQPHVHTESDLQEALATFHATQQTRKAAPIDRILSKPAMVVSLGWGKKRR